VEVEVLVDIELDLRSHCQHHQDLLWLVAVVLV
jgi:hypothetical protein